MSAPVRPPTDVDPSEVYQKMEATMLRQLLQSSGAFKADDVAGGQLRADMFIETLADAVAKGGGLGIAQMLQESLEPKDAPNGKGVGEGEGEGEGAGRPGGAASAVRRPGSMPAAPGGEVTSSFGVRHDPIDGTSKYHTGVDLRAAAGSPIAAARDGVVRRAGPRGGYGNAVEIDHGGGVSTLYAHASEVLVKPGQTVTAGQPIARVGQTGRATGPHLHFELRVGDTPVDPGAGGKTALISSRALNAYQTRVESTIAGKPLLPRSGGVP